MIVVAITGASGVIYGIRLLEVLNELNIENSLVISDAGKIVIESETRIELQKFLTTLINHKNEIRHLNNCRIVIDVDPSTTL